jgi:hypothetical protein
MALFWDCPIHKQWWWFSRCENPVAERSVRRRNFVAASSGIRCARTDAGATGRSATSSTKQLFVNRTIPHYLRIFQLARFCRLWQA